MLNDPLETPDASRRGCANKAHLAVDTAERQR